MTIETLKQIIIAFADGSRWKIEYFTVNASAWGLRELITFHEKENNYIGAVLPDSLPLIHPDTLILDEFMQEMSSIRINGQAYTYCISDLRP